MDGLTEVKAKLLDTVAVVSSVGTYKTKPAIYGRPVAPDKFPDKSITMYNSLPINGGLEYNEFGITVNCFAKKWNDVKTIQHEVFTSLNRKAGDNDAFFLCSKQQVIPAPGTAEDYNAPVEVLVRIR